MIFCNITMAEFKNGLEIATMLITIFGVPYGIWLYYKNNKKEREDKEYLVYDSLDNKHIEFLRLCLEHSSLNIYCGKKQDDATLTEDERNKKLIIHDMLISILERAYLLYKDKKEAFRQAQWTGWEKYIRQWMNTPDFYQSWKKLGDQYEVSFVEYMNTVRKD